MSDEFFEENPDLYKLKKGRIMWFSTMPDRSVERAVDATLRLEMQMELAGLIYDVEHGEDRLGDPEE